MKITDVIESKYLRQEDLPEGEEVIVTVTGMKKVNAARDDEEPEYKLAVKFEEYKAPLLANKINTRVMFSALGGDTKDWLGKQIIIYADPGVMFSGKVTGGLRVKALPKAKQPRQLSDDDANKALRQAGDDESDIPF